MSLNLKNEKLFEFLVQNEAEIIQICREKVLANSQAKPTSALLDEGLPIFYKELIAMLKRTAGSPQISLSDHKISEEGATAHGKESLRLGYTISQVVHAYGAVCQAITEFVQTKGFEIQAVEFRDLNLALDCAIAEAVTEFEKIQSENAGRSEAIRLGYFLHEMGNSLAAASIAHNMMQTGLVGISGTTSNILSRALEHMRKLIDRSMAQIRMSENTAVEPTRIRLVNIFGEVEASAMIMGKERGIRLEFNVDPSLELTADRHLVFSAVSNLVNNAMKFSREQGLVSVRGKESGDQIMIEVEDECGGLPQGKTEELFKPYAQSSADKSGMGLGLTLSRQAIELNHGTLTARSLSGKGCVFTILLPKKPDASRKAS